MADNPIISKKIELKNAWAELRGTGGEDKKRSAARLIVELEKEIIKLDPKFKPSKLETTQYGYLLIDSDADSGWPERKESEYMDTLESVYGDYVALAVDIVRKRSPDIEVSSPNLFGQIVNATIGNLLSLDHSIQMEKLAFVLSEADGE